MFRYIALGWHPDSGCDTKISFKPDALAHSQTWMTLDAYLKQVRKKIFSHQTGHWQKREASFKNALPPIGSMLDHVRSCWIPCFIRLNHIKSEMVNVKSEFFKSYPGALSKPHMIFFWGPQPTETGTLRLSTKPMVDSRQRENAWPATLVALLAGSPWMSRTRLTLWLCQNRGLIGMKNWF